jgi:hypothetical protein
MFWQRLIRKNHDGASMSMPMRFSLPVHAHESSMSMLMELSYSRKHEACTQMTTLGKSASCRDSFAMLPTHSEMCDTKGISCGQTIQT